MSPFRRKRDGEDESSEETVVQAEAAPTAADEPDPAAWALPADAGAVTTDAGTAATATAVEPESSGWAPPTSSSAGQDPMETFNEVAEQRPELLVAGAFAGAFVFARILKRITSPD